MILLKQPFSYVSIPEAWQMMSKANVPLLESEIVSIGRACGRISTRDVVSQVSIPRQDVSHYDGYAIRSIDTITTNAAPITLKVVGRIYPGEQSKLNIRQGEACYVATGASLPAGADTVLAVEMAKQISSDLIEVRKRIRPGEHVVAAASDIKTGDIVIHQGKTISSRDEILLAMLNIREIEVLTKPVVALLAVGDELVGKVSTHTLLLSRWIEINGGVASDLGVVADNISEIRKRLTEVNAHLVVTVGGSSMGEKDRVADALTSYGDIGRVLFHGIKIKPGRVSGMGVIDDKPIVMLPGLIQSTVVGFHILVLPLLQKMRGLPPTSAWKTVAAKVARTIEFRSFVPFKKVVFVTLKRTSEGFEAHPILGESLFFSTIARADGMILIEEDKTRIEEDEIVETHLLPS